MFAPHSRIRCAQYQASEREQLRAEFRRDPANLFCPRHPRQRLRVLWLQRARLPGGSNFVSLVQVICPACGMTAAIDMLEEHETPGHERGGA